MQSACFGLAQSLRKWGSAVGALAAFFLMKASNNNYQLIFYSASAVSLAACIAFVCFVPAHARVPTPAAPAAAAATAAASSTGAAASAVAEGSGKKPGFLHGAKEFLKSVSSMGTDFYRMLGVICMYALGHINESLLEVSDWRPPAGPRVGTSKNRIKNTVVGRGRMLLSCGFGLPGCALCRLVCISSSVRSRDHCATRLERLPPTLVLLGWQTRRLAPWRLGSARRRPRWWLRPSPPSPS